MTNVECGQPVAAATARSVVIIGVGNRMRGDDAVGCILCDILTGKESDSPQRHKDTDAETKSVVRRQKAECGSTGRDGQTPPQGRKDTKPSSEPSDSLGDLGVLGGFLLPDWVHVLDCGNAPENYLKPIADRNPGRILVVDCCEFGGKPGEFRVFSRPEIENLSYGLLSTHTLPLTLTIEMLSLETKATIELLGIQPQAIEFGTDLSEPVRGALPALVQFVSAWAREPQPSAP